MSQALSPSRREPEPREAPSDTLLTKTEIIVGYLQNLALPSLGNRELSEKDFAAWDKLLEPYSKDAISFAFESWVRNNKGFPQVSVIIALAKTHVVSEDKTFKGCGRCYEGWLYSRDDPRRYRLGVKRCPCFTAYVEQKKAA